MEFPVVIAIVVALLVWMLFGRFGLGLIVGVLVGLALAGTPADTWITDSAGTIADAVGRAAAGAWSAVSG
jgi:type IV secretory pathway TrbL component